MMAGPGCEFHVAQLSQLAPHRRLIDRDRKFIMKPLHQIDQPPTNNAVDGRDRTLLDDLDKRPALRIGQDRALAGSLAVEQSVRAAGIEPDHPIAHDLQRHTADLGSLASAAPVVNLRQRQQPRAWIALFDNRASRRSDAPSKSSRKPIAEPMTMPFETRAP